VIIYEGEMFRFYIGRKYRKYTVHESASLAAHCQEMVKLSECQTAGSIHSFLADIDRQQRRDIHTGYDSIWTPHKLSSIRSKHSGRVLDKECTLRHYPDSVVPGCSRGSVDS